MPQLTSLPIIPIPLNWEAPTTSKTLTDKASYAAGTVSERRRSSIVKRSLGTIAIEVAITNRDEVYNFLVGRAGKPFRFSPMQDAETDGKAWRCLQLTFRWVAPGLWIFVADFTEVGGKWIDLPKNAVVHVGIPLTHDTVIVTHAG